jgi:hypothetical protein
MQLRFAILDLTDPPANPTPTNPPTTPWQQIDEAARMVALEVLARLIAQMLAAQEATEMPNE